MKLSIITINYNNKIDLIKTIESTLSQTWTDFEYIIIDGGSTDGSPEVIESYKSHLSYWVSEPDNGIFHAINKGIEQAKGDYLLILNAGDVLKESDILFRTFGQTDYNEGILYGNVVLESKGAIIGQKVFSQPITFDFFRRTSISHQGTFVKRTLHSLVGMYDENLKFSSDWKFFLLCFCKYNVSVRHLDMFIATCNCDGLTWNPKHFPAIRNEMLTVMKAHFPAFIEDYSSFDKLRNRKNIFQKAFNYTRKSLRYILSNKK